MESQKIRSIAGQFLIGTLMVVVSINLGKLLGLWTFKLIMWLGILPYLEKFFGWFVF